MKRYLLILLGLMLVALALPAARLSAQASVNRCLVGPGLVPCDQYAATIRAAGFDPADTASCFVVMNNNVEKRSCTSAPFNIQPGQTVADAAANPDPQAAQNAQQSLAASAENPDQIDCNGPDSCLNNNPLIQILTVAMQVLSAAVGVVVVIVIVLAGIQYSTAGGNPNATSAAKKRILNAVLALVAWAFLFVFFQWLIPGGVF